MKGSEESEPGFSGEKERETCSGAKEKRTKTWGKNDRGRQKKRGLGGK